MTSSFTGNTMKTKTIVSNTRLLGVIGALALTLAAGSAQAFDIRDETSPQNTVELAYAPNLEERFGPAPLPEASLGDDSWEHELNDAWLGMTVISADGETLGYVIDAVVDNWGEVTDLVIAPDIDSEGEVFVPARLASLNEDSVSLALTKNDIAALETATESARALN